VRVARLDETDWLVNNYTSGLRIREGEMVRGGGGFYPPDADLAGLADGEVPADCEGPAVQLHDIAKFDPSKPDGIPDPPPPPPPAPSAQDTLLSQAFDEHWGGQRWPRRMIRNVADPREAMFTYVLETYEGREGDMRSHICLRGADRDLLARLDGRSGDTEPRRAQLCLIAERVRRPLSTRPHTCERESKDDEYLTPQYPGCRQGWLLS